ncbi:hypothetical protein T4D_11833 [Trichinella pseudospiralis]|uniref:Uncharacterized protein n=1 Tax=Trichinella pseudospiralis TaxID=6337 RepID=A0A0V1DPJ7_TRIPS|nr:hypothetical protein T4D_82 [Trichinella pseudospiralis]KRY64138.1 hypothetical protein T4D_11833 [Trichinella pseudospiralis]
MNLEITDTHEFNQNDSERRVVSTVWVTHYNRTKNYRVDPEHKNEPRNSGLS